MRQIKLVPKTAFVNHMEVEVHDFPNGLTSSVTRKRCEIDIDYMEEDIRRLQEQGLDHEGMLENYREQIIDWIEGLIGDGFEVAEGMEEVLARVSEHLPA